MESLADLLHIMAVHDNGVPAKGFHAGTVDVHVVLESSSLALTEPMDGGGEEGRVRGRGGELEGEEEKREGKRRERGGEERGEG